jgi:hypothetical protein
MRIVIGLAGIALCGVLPVAQADEYKLNMVPFAELSERHVSRQGDAALNLAGVQWQHSESDHFIFHTETGFAVTQLVGVAEWSYGAIKKDLEVAQDSFERKCHVYVFLNEPVWHEFVRIGKRDAWTGGWCTGRELFFQSRPHFKFQGTTLPHEITHLVLHRFVGGDIPLWLNEGFAEFEGIRLCRLYLKLRRQTLVSVRDHLERDQYVALKDLTATVDYPKERNDVEFFYTESERLVRFLYDQHGGMTPLIKFLKLQSQGSRFESAWREVYGAKYGDASAFEEQFIKYVTKAKP